MKSKKKNKTTHLKSKVTPSVKIKRVTKKEITKLKELYKKGKLKFNSKKIAKDILKDLTHGLTK